MINNLFDLQVILQKAVDAGLKASVIKTFNDAASGDYLDIKPYTFDEKVRISF